jgi:hypothetical protein
MMVVEGRGIKEGGRGGEQGKQGEKEGPTAFWIDRDFHISLYKKAQQRLNDINQTKRGQQHGTRTHTCVLHLTLYIHTMFLHVSTELN